MDVTQWKVDKIHGLISEVRDVHPVLQDLFVKMPSIKTAHYTHGSQEMGADFVLVREDELLLQERYVGVIVKADDIKQDHSDIRRQIEECEVERTIEGGKKKIFITELWVITTKSITRNAQEKLHKDYKSSNLVFVDGEKLAKLIDIHNPSYWEYETVKLGTYVSDERLKIQSLSKSQNLLPASVEHIRLDQYLYSTTKKKNKFQMPVAEKYTTLETEISKRKTILIEGTMGSGKSELLRHTATNYLDPKMIETTSILPYFLTFKELKERFDFDAIKTVEFIRTKCNAPGKTVLILVDGLDEVADEIQDVVDQICAFSNALLGDDLVKIVAASRQIDSPILHEQLEKTFDCFSVAPVHFGSLFSFIDKICAGKVLPDRFRSDLQNSQLMKALPRTPLSAILLAKLLSENVQELPSTLPELYSKYTELVLGRWDISKGNGSEKEYETIYRLTATLATFMFSNDIDVLAVSDLKSIFKEYLDKRQTGQKVETLLTNFLARSEIVSYNQETKTIRFRHRTFNEYFFAQNMFWAKGREAPINRPFDPHWTAVEYFYLGIVKDAPHRISELSAYIADDERGRLTKIYQIGAYMLAAYQTPYDVVVDSVYAVFKDAASLYCSIVNKKVESPLQIFPEFQLLSIFTMIVREAYAYDFFEKSLLAAKMQLQLDSIEQEDSMVMEFFIDSVLSSLGSVDAFVRLVDTHEHQLKWALRMGITCAAGDVAIVNDATRRIEKKNRRNMSGNHSLQKYIYEMQTVPLQKRKIED